VGHAPLDAAAGLALAADDDVLLIDAVRGG
jgi:hypothetical protein